MAVAAIPKAKPAAPEAMPPINPPIHSEASVAVDNEEKISDHIEQEQRADRKARGQTDRDRDAGALAHRQEFDREHAQP